MTDREKQLIDAYIPTPRDESLVDEYFVKGQNENVYKVRIKNMNFHIATDEVRYGVVTSGGKVIKCGNSDYGDFPMRLLYDNKQDCQNETHNWFNGWEHLRKIQKEEMEATP